MNNENCSIFYFKDLIFGNNVLEVNTHNVPTELIHYESRIINFLNF